MSSITLPAGVGRYVDLATELASRLDFASRVADPRHRLAEQLITVKRLWWDLSATASGAGLEGARLFEVATAIRDQLATAVDAHDQDGNLEPWGRCRDRVLELLATMRASCPTTAVVDAVVTRAAHPAPAAATVDCPTAIPQTNGEKGEKGEKPSDTFVVLERIEKRFLLTLVDNGSFSRKDALSKPNVIPFGRRFGKMLKTDVRKAAKSLIAKGLIKSDHPGYWLTEKGLAVARRFPDCPAAPKK